jgi:hypothetical protein
VVRLRKSRFDPVRGGGFRVRLGGDERALLGSLPDQLEALMAGGAGPGTVRLFPPAYAQDAELDAEYQRLMHEELIRRRLEALAVVRETLDAGTLTEDQLHAWVRVLNDVRLVLGTLLDVSEDSDVLDADPDGEDYGQRVVYVVLSDIVDDGVSALANALA